jgi:SET domain
MTHNAGCETPALASRDHDPFHPTLSNFHDFIQSADMTISPQIQIQELPGRGLGIVAATHIKAGTELMWVSSSAILQPPSVPESFVPMALRGENGTAKEEGRVGLRAHALLAAWIAFGDCGEHEAWMATWPSLEEMKVGMPLCWPGVVKGVKRAPELLKGRRQMGSGGQNQKPIRNVDHFAVLPWDVTGACAIMSSDLLTMPIRKMKRQGSDHKSPETSTPPPTGLLAKQQAKFEQDLRAVRRVVSHVSDALNDTSTQEYASFLHAWLIVNSRCFYYIPTGCPMPEDSDEAMALCPVVDIFNHNDGEGGSCDVTHDDDGFTVKVSEEMTRGYREGEELFVIYGGHGNDMLWVEYGFLLDRNKWDSVSIPDAVVLGGLSVEMRELVEEKGYLGGYTIRDEGVCWRTEVVGWLGEVSRHEWEQLVDGLWMPEDDEDEGIDIGINNGVEEVIYRDTPRRRVMRNIVDWALQLKQETENSLFGLMSMEIPEVREVFGDEEAVATQRLEMTIKRWKQIWAICMKALRSIELDCPGSFVIPSQPGRSFEDLDSTIEDFLAEIKSVQHTPNGNSLPPCAI